MYEILIILMVLDHLLQCFRHGVMVPQHVQSMVHVLLAFYGCTIIQLQLGYT